MTTRSRPATSLLNTRSRALRRQLPLAVEGDVRAVHQARVASRRLREAVPVLATGGKRPKIHKAARVIRKLTRTLGTVRELDVTLELIDELSDSGDLSAAALHDVRLHVEEERAARRDAMLAKISSIDPEKFDRRMHALAESAVLAAEDRWRQTLTTRVLKRAKRLEEQIDRAGQLYAPEQLHEVRIATKKLRYALELAADGGVTGAATLVRALKRVQATLGRLHDLQVLLAHVGAVQVAATASSAPHQGLAAVAGRIEEQCRLLHGRYVGSIPQLREVIASVRGELAAHLARSPRAVKGRPERGPLKKRPLKMTRARRRAAAGDR